MIVTLWGALLILLGFVGVLVLLCAWMIRYQNNHPSKHYDERQIAFQGKSYAFGLVVGGIYYTVFSFYLLAASDNLPEGGMISLLVLTGVLISLTATELYCMMTGALLPLNDKMDQIFGFSCLMAALALIGIIVHICFDGMSIGDDPVGVWKDLIQFVWFTFQAIIYRIAKWRDQRQTNE